MGSKSMKYIELAAVYLIITLIASFSTLIVSFGNSMGIKMFLMLLIYVFMAGAALAAFRLSHKNLSEFKVSRENLSKQITTGVLLYVVIAIVLIVIPMFFGLESFTFKASSMGILVFYIIFDFFFVGFGEEIIFRGYFYTRFLEITGSKWMGVILSSLLFGLWHYPANQSIAQVIFTMVLGFIYGMARYKIKNCTLLSLAIAHGLHDVFILLLSYFLQ